VKTRIGYGPESEMPIVDLARRLEDVGVSALTVHCRTAVMRHNGAADWAWARRAQEVVRIPVLVNGDVKTAEDCRRALVETRCAGVMIGRSAIDHPWVFREARALLDTGRVIAPPTRTERFGFLIRLLKANVEYRGEKNGTCCTRRHYAGVLRPLAGGEALKEALYRIPSHVQCLELLEEALHARPTQSPAPGPAAASRAPVLLPSIAEG
jgi:tRNA-dihydrouridine synthase B